MQNQEKLQILLFELEALMRNDIDNFTPQMQREVAMRIYQLESKFSTYREKLDLVPIDGKFYSQSILNSFFEEKEVHKFLNEVELKYKEYWSTRDYQYSLLGFLLVFHDEIQSKTLHEIIQLFLEIHKENLSYGDIEMTKTGKTRCDTNIRFAFKALREMGLIREHNQKDEKGNSVKRWTLSLLGYLVAISFIHIPEEEYDHILKAKLYKSEEAGQNVNVDAIIVRRILNLRNYNFWDKISGETVCHEYENKLNVILNYKTQHKLFKNCQPLLQEISEKYNYYKDKKLLKAGKGYITLVEEHENKINFSAIRNHNSHSGEIESFSKLLWMHFNTNTSF